MPLTSIILIWRCVKRQAGKAEVKLVLTWDHRVNKQTVEIASTTV